MAENKQFGNSEQLDTISRQATLDAIRKLEKPAPTAQHLSAIFDCEDTIKALPSAQKKGHWIDEGTNYSCSECHRGCWVNSNYCPWCGADMRGEDDE